MRDRIADGSAGPGMRGRAGRAEHVRRDACVRERAITSNAYAAVTSLVSISLILVLRRLDVRTCERRRPRCLRGVGVCARAASRERSLAAHSTAHTHRADQKNRKGRLRRRSDALRIPQGYVPRWPVPVGCPANDTKHSTCIASHTASPSSLQTLPLPPSHSITLNVRRANFIKNSIKEMKCSFTRFLLHDLFIYTMYIFHALNYYY